MSALFAFVVIGLAAGSIYAVAATGLVLTYRASGVFNFAHGSIATVAAYVFYVGLADTPWPIALPVTVLVVGVVGGAVMEWLTRQVRNSTYAGMVVTIGLVLVVQGVIWVVVGTDARFVDSPLPKGSLRVARSGARIGLADVGLVAIGIATMLVLHQVTTRTRIGLLMRAVVENPALVGRMGTNPNAVRRAAWMVGMAAAALAGVFLAPQVGLEPVVLTFLVVQSFGAAAIGGFRSLTMTYLGALGIGVVSSLASAYLTAPALRNVPTAVPFLVLVAVLVIAPPADLRERVVRGLRTARPATPLARVGAASVVGILVVLAVPHLAGTRLPVFTAAAASVVTFLGLSLITNLAGHLSLCHAALAAIGATSFANLVTVVPWGFALAGGALMVVPVAVAISVVAGRLSEVAVAIATFGFANLLVSVGYGTAWMFGAAGTRATPRPAGFGADERYFVLVALVAIACCVAVAIVDRARPGRVFRALAVSPETLGALGTSPVAARAALFAVGGVLAGLGGALAAAGNFSASAVGYPPILSLLWVAALAFGGRGVVMGAVRAGLAVVLVPYFLDPLVADHSTWMFGAVAVVVAVVASMRLRTAS